MLCWSENRFIPIVIVLFGCATEHQVRRTPTPRPVEDRPIVKEQLPLVTVTPDIKPPTSDPSLRQLRFTTPTGRNVTLTWRKRSVSIGSTIRGRLENGRKLPEQGLGYIHNGPNSYGTDELVTILLFAVAEVTKEYPGTVPVVIGALSKEGGGRIRPHRSHRSGRDVDIGYYAKHNRAMKTFEPLDLDDIDYEKTLFLITTLLSTGRVQMIFVNRAIQAGLYRAARDAGYDDRQLEWMFEYPRSAKVGVIRHARGHRRHFHVRFVCPDGDVCDD